MKAVSRDQSSEPIARFATTTNWGALVVDRTTPFDPASFIDEGWGIAAQDDRALEFGQIDFSDVSFEHGLADGETTITGEEKLARLKETSVIRLDAKAGQTLYEEKGQTKLRFLYDTHNVDWFELAGTELLSPSGGRYFLYLYRDGDGPWDWNYRWLDDGGDRRFVSPVLASSVQPLLL